MRNKLFLAVFILGFMFWSGSIALAENIDPADNGHQYAWSENAGWLNFEPAQGVGVTVDSDYITGYVWAENIGWINLNPATAGVTNDGRGNLSGWAWGENVGWISFSCKNTGSCGSIDYGVTINSNSLFDGYAWGENIGWINFKLISQPDYIVETSYGTGDIDMDTIPDLADNCPNICNSQQLDADIDGIGDVCDDTSGCGGCGQPDCEQACDVDNDSDGVMDIIDNCPLNCNSQQLDADSDGIGDVCDGSPGCGGGSCGGSEPACETEC